ncbi:hypothetical protein [uncultured Cellulomonas sp.]|uniref:hypothetical protein n=1 Tax=uncultured Cellulomonas sp. TaxID=189682 RepID=UPI0028E387E6|nr:hypothetical protein [uncultured Cellulomonas sp.]
MPALPPRALSAALALALGLLVTTPAVAAGAESPRAGSSAATELARAGVNERAARVMPPTRVTPGRPHCMQWEAWPGVVVDPTGYSTEVVLNVTTVSPTAPGYVVAYSDLGYGVPPTSTVNFLPGSDVANVTVVSLHRDVPFCVAAGGSAADVILDLQAVLPLGRHVNPFRSERLIDTRAGSGIGDLHGALPDRRVATSTLGSLYWQTQFVLANVTVPAAAAPGNVRIFAHGDTLPPSSTANYLPGRDRATAAILPVDPELRVDLYSDTTSGGRGTDVIVDVYGDLYGATFTSAQKRVLDTRTGVGAARARVAAAPGGATLRIPVGSLGAPPTATVAILSVVSVAPSALGHVRVFPERTPGSGTMPATSSLNHLPGVDSSNLVWVDLWADGDIALSSWQNTGSTDLVVDVVGYLQLP